MAQLLPGSLSTGLRIVHWMSCLMFQLFTTELSVKLCSGSVVDSSGIQSVLSFMALLLLLLPPLPLTYLGWWRWWWWWSWVFQGEHGGSRQVMKQVRWCLVPVAAVTTTTTTTYAAVSSYLTFSFPISGTSHLLYCPFNPLAPD